MSHIIKRYTNQLVTIFILILLTVFFASYIASYQLNESMTNVYLRKLSALKSSLKVNIEKYFNDKTHIVRTVSQTTDVKNAMLEFGESFFKAEDEYGSEIDSSSMVELLKEHTKRVFYSIPGSPQKKPFEEYMAKNANGKILQHLYIADSPFESSNKYMFFNSSKGISYDTTHKKFHQYFVDILKRHNFYDIFLINTDGDIVYSVFKELDFATNLKRGAYRDSSLANAFNNALENKGLEFSDFRPYEPSYNRAASFFTIPIFKDEKIIGVMAFQISIKDINKIMTFNEHWKSIGLGDTGESYLVGDDYMMRSDSRFQASMENMLVNELATTVGIIKVRTKATDEALNGKSDQSIVTDYRGDKVLSSYTPVNIIGKLWALVVEIDKAEVDREIRKTILTVIGSGLLLAVLLMLFLGYMIVRLIVRPIESFEKELDMKIEARTKELKISNAILNDYKRAVDEGSIVSKTDLEGRIKYVNDAFCEISGYEQEELIGKNHSIIRHPDTPKKVFEDLWRTIQNKRVWKGVIKNKRKNGSEYIVKSTIMPILDDKKNIVEYISIRTDITDLVSKEKKLLEQLTDELTKLPNRVKLLEDITNSRAELKLALVQINKFKEVNDYYGRQKGDMILMNFASIIKKIVAEKNVSTYKVGSGEFVLMADEKTTIGELTSLMENIIKYFDHNMIVVGSDSFNISISAGIAQGREEKLFYDAEMALRKVNESSKSIMVFENVDDIEKEYENNIHITKKIKQAIKNDHILVYGQPIEPNFEGGKPKYECLVRMYDEENKKILSPFFFLEISKKARLYPTITKIVIEKAFDYFNNKKDEFSINLSIEDILDHNMTIFLKKKIDQYKIGHRLVLELVESEGIENFDEIHAFIKEFKGYGCKIAIDDFGTGYSNFEYLMKLDADYIKIDGSLIKDIDTDKNSQIVVELIVDFAKRMNIKTIAEFIHSDSVYKKVKELGIDYSQGYYLGEPKNLYE